MKPVTSFRIDPELIKKARENDLPIREIFEAALADRLGIQPKCPYCGNELMKTKKQKASKYKGAGS